SYFLTSSTGMSPRQPALSPLVINTVWEAKPASTITAFVPEGTIQDIRRVISEGLVLWMPAPINFIASACASPSFHTKTKSDTDLPRVTSSASAGVDAQTKAISSAFLKTMVCLGDGGFSWQIRLGILSRAELVI
ncbi:hypothetical protein, partial [Agrobacterium pusense]|uniref:hypothetical protein n=1 Tax=Agrobacterium pusense TaxID=648995 RepID=UPI001AEE3FB5